MPRAAFVLACCAACAAPRQQEIAPIPPRPVDAGECARDGGTACYDKGRALLESRNPDSAQESMEYVDCACAAGLEKACDLSDLAFKAPRRIGGRSPHTTREVRQEHRAGTVAVRLHPRDRRPLARLRSAAVGPGNGRGGARLGGVAPVRACHLGRQPGGDPLRHPGGREPLKGGVRRRGRGSAPPCARSAPPAESPASSPCGWGRSRRARPPLLRPSGRGRPRWRGPARRFRSPRR